MRHEPGADKIITRMRGASDAAAEEVKIQKVDSYQGCCSVGLSNNMRAQTCTAELRSTLNSNLLATMGSKSKTDVS